MKRIDQILFQMSQTDSTVTKKILRWMLRREIEKGVKERKEVKEKREEKSILEDF
jgi:hypothetical protein